MEQPNEGIALTTEQEAAFKSIENDQDLANDELVKNAIMSGKAMDGSDINIDEFIDKRREYYYRLNGPTLSKSDDMSGPKVDMSKQGVIHSNPEDNNL